MKLITLNVWGGRKEALLADFFSEYKDSIDIFCLQEVVHDAGSRISEFPENNPNFFADIDDILTNHTGHFRSSAEPYYGLAVFVRDDLKVKEEDDIFVSGSYGDSYDLEADEDHARNVQHLEIEGTESDFVVHNFHGMWTKQGKIDTPKRIQQAENVAEHLKEQELPQVLCGDFNMRPDTESIQIIESVGLRNLVTEHGVTDTRTKFYEKEERFADYVLVSDGIQVNDFKVLPDEVSDHAPLYLDFDIA